MLAEKVVLVSKSHWIIISGDDPDLWHIHTQELVCLVTETAHLYGTGAIIWISVDRVCETAVGPGLTAAFSIQDRVRIVRPAAPHQTFA